MLTDTQLARLVQDFYGLILDGEGQGRLTRGAIHSDVRERRIAQYETMVARNRDALACNRLEEAGFVTEHMLRKQGIAAADLSPADLAQARQAMLRAGIDIADAIKARYEGDFNFEPRDRLLKMRLESASEQPVPTASPAAASDPEPAVTQRQDDSLSVVGVAFRTTQVATGAWDRQTASQASATFRLFVDVCGDRPLAAYSRKEVGRFRELVERLPNDYGKHPRYRDLTVEEILTIFDALPAGSRAPVITQKCHTAPLTPPPCRHARTAWTPWRPTSV
ncbi:hypothetical protein MKK68_01745 [Methylobacterium sp. E-016]|uniref:hypothetical protein n=1 Tax=Methylobacterium sp. E-016 TaxID=2836556 RepID=UPI001FBB2940|nr:hypothetical protein [Methylobacterium sp. E-016]MCJ2074385.1 hypothetical protein [Methylobacterium sp. E-016]